MAIAGQQNINIGQPNQGANSDTLYTAFQKTQNNFTTLFSTGSPVTSITAGLGINVAANTASSFVITNTGVTRLLAGTGVTITDGNGSPANSGTLIINSTGGGNGGGGTVTSVGLVSNTLSVANSPIVTSGNILVDLPNLVSSGNYVNPNITVDAQGRITAVSNGSVSGTVTSVGLLAGAGISVAGGPITSNGNITVTNTGVTSLIAGTGIVLSAGNGAVTISSTGGGSGGSGTVTRVGVTSSTLSVTGSPIISQGNINIEMPSNYTANNLGANTLTAANVNSGFINVTSSNSIPRSMIQGVYAANIANTGSFEFYRARGSVSSPLPVQFDDLTLRILNLSYTQFGAYQLAGSILFQNKGQPANSTSGVPTDLTFNTVDSSNVQHRMVYRNNGSLIVPNAVAGLNYANTATALTSFSGKSRGSYLAPLPTNPGDTIMEHRALAYTGNGTQVINEQSGWAFGGRLDFTQSAAVSVSGGNVPTNFNIRTIASNGNSTTYTFSSTGNLTIPGVYVGNATGLTGIPGGNIVGAVPYATIANSVAGGNVFGVVATAALALSVDGPNVTGTVPRAASAAVANLVAGGNVSGTVTSAFSVVGNNQPNITAVGTLSSLTVTGNLSCGNLSIDTAPSANTTATVVATIPVVINGVTYKLMLAAA